MQQFLRTKTLLSFVFALSFVCVPTLALAQEDGEQQGPAPEQQQQYDEPTQSAQTSSDDNSLYGGSTEGASTASFSFFDTPALETSGWGGEGSLGEPQVGEGSTGFSELQQQLTQSAEQTYNGPTEVPIEYSNGDQQDLLNSQLPNKYDYINQSLTNTNNVGTYDFFPEGVTGEFATIENQFTRNGLDEAYKLNNDIAPVSALDYQRLDQAQAPAQQDALNAQLDANGTNAQNIPPAPLQEAWDWFVGGLSGNTNNDGAGFENGGGQGGGPVSAADLGTTFESGIKELRASPETGSKEDYIFSEKNGGSWIPIPLSGQERTDVVNRLQAEGYLAEGQNAKIVEVRDGAINAEPIGFGIPGISPTSGASPTSSKEEEIGSNAGGKPLPYDEKESTLVPAGQTLTVADGKGTRLLLATPGVGGSSPAPEQASTPAPSTQSGGGFQNFVSGVGSAVSGTFTKVADGISSSFSSITNWFSGTPAQSTSGGTYLERTPSLGDSPVNQAQTPVPTPVSAPAQAPLTPNTPVKPGVGEEGDEEYFKIIDAENQRDRALERTRTLDNELEALKKAFLGNIKK